MNDPKNTGLNREQEWKQQRMPLRIALFVLAIAVAVTAFGSIVVELFSTEGGWQQVSPTATKSGITQEFILEYNAGLTGKSVNSELKAISVAYSEALENAYTILEDGVAAVNAHPNETVTVDPLLYDAFAKLADSLWLYQAPIREQYNGVFHSQTDEDAALFDPAKSPEIAEYVAELAALVQNPDMISLELLPDSQVCLHVSDAYLAHAQENEFTTFVDFGVLRNAFLCDAAADVLTAQGYTNGYLASYDGYTRALCAEQLGLNLFDYADGKTTPLGAVNYNGPAALAMLRAFPLSTQPWERYYTYADGTVVTPFIGSDGLAAKTPDTLIVFAETAADAAIQALDGFMTGKVSAASWIQVQDGAVISEGEQFTLRLLEQ